MDHSTDSQPPLAYLSLLHRWQGILLEDADMQEALLLEDADMQVELQDVDIIIITIFDQASLTVSKN